MQIRIVEPQADETRSETDKVAVQTRLTAEQFLAQQGLADLSLYWPTGKPLPKIDYESKEAAPTLLQLLEAFRDKSEESLQSDVKLLTRVLNDARRCFGRNGVIEFDCLESENKGLLEEIERLKRRLREMTGDRDQGIKNQSELRAKLASTQEQLDDADAENGRVAAEAAALRVAANTLLDYIDAHNWGSIPEPFDSINPLLKLLGRKALSAAPERGKEAKS